MKHGLAGVCISGRVRLNKCVFYEGNGGNGSEVVPSRVSRCRASDPSSKGETNTDIRLPPKPTSGAYTVSEHD